MVATEVERSDAQSSSKSRSSRSRKPASTSNEKTPRIMTNDHKLKIAEGREMNKVVGRYLDALARVPKPKKGRQISEEDLRVRLEKVETDLLDASGSDRLVLAQRRKDLEARLEVQAPEIDMSDLEAEFVKVAKTYAQRKHIDRATFVEVGVPAEVLKAAGI